MIKYTRCQECKSDTIAAVADSLEKVTCKHCGNRSAFYIDLTNSRWAQERIAEWVAKKDSPKFFDDDGDPGCEVQADLDSVEELAYSIAKKYFDRGMTKLELRAFTERLVNVAHKVCITQMIKYPREQR